MNNRIMNNRYINSHIEVDFLNSLNTLRFICFLKSLCKLSLVTHRSPLKGTHPRKRTYPQCVLLEYSARPSTCRILISIRYKDDNL